MSLLAVLAVLVGCGEDGSPPRAAPAAGGGSAGRPGLTTFRDERAGFSVAFPSTWRRATTSLTPALSGPTEILSVGTGTLRPGDASRCAQFPTHALQRLGRRDVFLTVQEHVPGTKTLQRARRELRAA